VKAIRCHEFGSTDVLRQEEVERPVPGADLVTAAPRSIALTDAASLPLAGLAARQAAVAVRTADVFTRPDAAHLADLVSRVDNGVLRLHIADRRPLEELPAVHQDESNGKLLGKTVILV
jgi:NADPH:quinone reductase-like Zn-dependent oxidoreductase